MRQYPSKSFLSKSLVGLAEWNFSLQLENKKLSENFQERALNKPMNAFYIYGLKYPISQVGRSRQDDVER